MFQGTDRICVFQPSVCTTVNDVSKQIASPLLRNKPRRTLVKMETISTKRCFFFLKSDSCPQKGLKHLDTNREIQLSMVYGNECTCKAQSYNWVRKLKTGIRSLHEADHRGRADKGRGTPVAEKSRRSFFLYWNQPLVQKWHISLGNHEDHNEKVLFFLY